MSIAGKRSNRGDGYQTLVAFHWALSVLSDSEYQWIEVDSVSYEVDDVVIGKTDGTLLCCQCKKNQINFKPWTIADLADELGKAAKLLSRNKKAVVRFYSRSPFSELAKLKEHSTTQPDEATYRKSLEKNQSKIDDDLAKWISSQEFHLSTYDFLCRTSFETSQELEQMEASLRERLSYMASSPEAAYNALWTRLDQLGGSMGGSGGISASAQHRLTKEDLKALLHQAGAMLVPFMDLDEVRTSFAGTSAIGRAWRRDIAGRRIPNPVLNDLLSAIDNGKKSILLTGLPGSGKTCVMIDLQETLEKRAQTCQDLVPLFIQSREFADLSTAQDREAQGLPEKWIEKAARMAEESKIVVIVDSLDVLSISREHSVLTYFLAQIDRLSMISNISVVTACRDFDRQYDRRISERQWECELKCQPLNWESEIAPLLDMLGINITGIDTGTRELVRNPRELALFVDLAQREGSFNVVTGQELALRYLDTFVRANGTLGEAAMEAIENIAHEMLISRKLAVPRQRFTASQDIQRSLLSLNVLQKTQSGALTFGHQTLLDVLVISGAVRRGDTLNQFIQGLPPVPFVRPSIRRYVEYLATGVRREFRKQLRTILTGSTAFQIRRLVAEFLAGQAPQDNYWPLIRDLRDKHRDVFQVIYTQGQLIEWHYFWLRYLVPTLKDARDVEGITAHAHRVSHWKNEDTAGVLGFWTEIWQLSWMDGKQIVMQLSQHIAKLDGGNLALAVPLLEGMLSIPRQEHTLLGHALSRCVAVGLMEDIWLWQYIEGDIIDKDVLEFRFNDKLKCRPHEFGNSSDNFLLQRMLQSTKLLDLALDAIERWSRIKSSRYKNNRNCYQNNFLLKTSYDNTHSQHDHRHKDSENILLDSMEAAILNHAETHSDWWKANREHLCFNHEGALRYFAILAFTANPEANIDLIGRILKDKSMLECDLSFELGTLIQQAFIYLDIPAQEEVIGCILTLYEDKLSDEQNLYLVMKKRSEFILTIPCHLRSSEAQALLNDFEKRWGTLVRHPHKTSWSGIVNSPFSFEIFHQISDKGVLRLLVHYSGYQRCNNVILEGGEEQVHCQLQEASSRQPDRFLRLLSVYWDDISDGFRDAIMNGVTQYLRHRYGNLQTNGKWEPLEEPDAPFLAAHVLDELEKHPVHWHHNREASSAIRACAHVIKDISNAERLVSLAMGFADLREESTIKGDPVGLITDGINMMTGHVAEGLMILANNFQERNIPFPELLSHVLIRFAENGHPAIRALILRQLPYLQGRNPELGWSIFNLAMQNAEGLWQSAESCLYYAYHNHFERVGPILARLHSEGKGKDMETWGRISALSTLPGHIDIAALLNELKALNSTEAWQGAAGVWTHPENIRQHRELCLTGIEAGLKTDAPNAGVVAKELERLFHENEPIISIPTELIHRCLTIFEGDTENKHHRLFGFSKWLGLLAYQDPMQALAVAEIYLAYVNRTRPYLFDHENNLTRLMTRLFAEAEEREEADEGSMLQRVVSLQDMLLSLGVDSVNDWLKAAERP